MVTSPNEWKIHEWDDKPQTNKPKKKTKQKDIELRHRIKLKLFNYPCNHFIYPNNNYIIQKHFLSTKLDITSYQIEVL